MDIAKLGRKVETMFPFMCGDLNCKLRQRVTLSDDGTLKTKRPQKKAGTVVSGSLTKDQSVALQSAADIKDHPADIEPLNPDEL